MIQVICYPLCVFLNQIMEKMFFREQGERICCLVRIWASLRSSVVLGGRNNTFCGIFLFFWCKGDRVTLSRQEMKAKIYGGRIPGEKEKKKRASKYSSFPNWSFSYMYFNFAFWKYICMKNVCAPVALALHQCCSLKCNSFFVF